MSEEKKSEIPESEFEASERRAARLKEVMEEKDLNKDSELAKLLAEIESRNKN